MMLLSACEDGDILNTIRITLIVLDVIKNLLAVIVIIMGIKDFMGASINGKEESAKDAWKMLVRRIIAALVVFFLPTIMEAGIKAIDVNIYAYHECIVKATPEEIKNAYYNKAKKLVKEAKESLNREDYSDAKGYLEKVEDPARKKELEKELSIIDGYITISEEISGMTRKDQYDSMKEKINKVSDGDVKAKLTKQLEDKKKNLKDPPKKEEKNNSSDNDANNNNNPQQNTNIGGSVVKKEESDTLKVTISKVGSYYISQIWVKDAYSQLNKYDSPQYGSNLYKPGNLLANAVSINNLNNKIVIGFNASGFYLKDTYDAASVNYYPPYNKTSVGSLVITNGRVVRNAYDKAYKTWFIAGVDKSNTLQIYTDERTNDVNAKKQWSERVISSIRNTFTFASPLVMNGQASNITISMPSPGSSLNRQAMCQIDSNNFALITGSNLNRNNLIDIMLKLNCKTGTNFDGGGSIALLYKDKNSNSIQTIVGNGRALTEVGYFTE